MRNYSYQATNQQGELVSGEIAAESASSALKDLENRGLSVRAFNEIGSEVQVTKPVEQHSAFYRRIDEALTRRESLIPALEALAEELPVPSGQRELRQLIDKLQRSPNAVDLIEDQAAGIWLPLLVGGIAKEFNTRRFSETVAEALRENECRKQRRRALAYPAVLLVLALLFFGVVCAFLVPTFETMFTEFGLSLPLPTQVLFWCSEQIRLHLPRLLIVLFSTIAVCYALTRRWIRSALATRLFGFIMAGCSSNLSAMASFTHSLAELLSIDASLPEALRIAGRNCRHPHFEHVAQALADHIILRARPLNQFCMVHNLPPSVIHALQIGSDGGPNIPLLRELSSIYSNRVRMRVEWSASAIAPLAMIAIGAVIAFVVIALFMPLVGMVSSLA